MPRPTDPARAIDDVTARLGWSQPQDENADLDALIALQGKPRRKVTAAKVIAHLAKAGTATTRTKANIPFENPCADGLARAARNGTAIPADVEARMRADKARARAERASRQPKA